MEGLEVSSSYDQGGSAQGCRTCGLERHTGEHEEA